MHNQSAQRQGMAKRRGDAEYAQYFGYCPNAGFFADAISSSGFVHYACGVVAGMGQR
jgi:hypothetical protein